MIQAQYMGGGSDLWARGEAQRQANAAAAAKQPYDLMGYGANYAGEASAAGDAGTKAQLAALRMYGRGVGGSGPSVAHVLGDQQQGQNARAAAAMAGAVRGGGAAAGSLGAIGAGSAAQADASMRAAQLRSAEQQQAMLGYAQIAEQLYGQRQAYDQLAMQRALQGDKNALGWYSAQRGLDVNQQAIDRDFYGRIINSGMGALGGASSFAGSLGGQQ